MMRRMGDKAHVRAANFHYPALDGLRAIAVTMVFCSHALYGHLLGGFVGVDVFFVLSGYLITGVLRRPDTTIGQFYLRRAQRLLPALLLGTLLAVALWRDGYAPDVPVWSGVWPALFYVANFVAMHDLSRLNLLGPTWSLSMEEQFYMVWPPVLALIARRHQPWVYPLVGAAVFATLRFTVHPSYFSPVAHLDAVLIGSALALAPKMPRVPWMAWALFAALPFCMMHLLNLPDEAYARGAWVYPLVGLGTAAVISECVAERSLLARLLSARPLVWIGARSYGVYLYNFPITRWALLEGLRRPHDPLNFAMITLLRFGVCLALAELSYRFVERPVLAFRFARAKSAGMASR